MNIKIIDCTIRDGGHVNNWDFNPDCVKASYNAALKSGIDYFEIGYRFSSLKENLGHFAYCQDDFLYSLIEPSKKCKLLVMADVDKSDCNLFPECKPENTLIYGVRIASYPDKLEKAIKMAEELKSKNYEVFLNIMTFSELSDDQYKILKEWKNKEVLSVIYFADSFGSFIPSDISAYVQKLKDAGFCKIGFHSHNNLQLAFSNTLKAIDEGVEFIDASIFGMGRDAGNLPIEIIVGLLEKRSVQKYTVLPYLNVIEQFYLDIFESHKWGYKLQSLLSGLKNIHPGYVNDLFGNSESSIEDIWYASDFVKENYPISYRLR